MRSFLPLPAAFGPLAFLSVRFIGLILRRVERRWRSSQLVTPGLMVWPWPIQVALPAAQ
jgi:hypothetical protein